MPRNAVCKGSHRRTPSTSRRPPARVLRWPVLVLTRAQVLDVRHVVTVAEVTTSTRGIAAEVGFDAGAGLD